MTHSEQINELAAAMATAQTKMTGAKKDSANPFFKSKYADLASVREACLPAMNAAGLSVWQLPRTTVAEGQWVVEVETVVMHVSGQFIRDTLTVPVGKPDAQAVGSALTYARRYALAAIAGVASEDDDGNAAVATNGHAKAEPVVKPKGFEQWAFDMKATADDGIDALQKAWKASTPEMRAYATKHEAVWWNKCKERASEVVQ